MADSGVWMAYHSDWSGFVVFASEIAALRHAVENSMQVGFVTWGMDLGGDRYPDRVEPNLNV